MVNTGPASTTKSHTLPAPAGPIMRVPNLLILSACCSGLIHGMLFWICYSLDFGMSKRSGEIDRRQGSPSRHLSLAEILGSKRDRSYGAILQDSQVVEKMNKGFTLLFVRANPLSPILQVLLEVIDRYCTDLLPQW